VRLKRRPLFTRVFTFTTYFCPHLKTTFWTSNLPLPISHVPHGLDGSYREPTDWQRWAAGFNSGRLSLERWAAGWIRFAPMLDRTSTAQIESSILFAFTGFEIALLWTGQFWADCGLLRFTMWKCVCEKLCSSMLGVARGLNFGSLWQSGQKLHPNFFILYILWIWTEYRLEFSFHTCLRIPLSNLGRGLRTRRGYPSESSSWSTAATSFLRRFAWPSCVLRTSWRTHVSFLQFVQLGHFLNIDSHTHTHIYRHICIPDSTLSECIIYKICFFLHQCWTTGGAPRSERGDQLSLAGDVNECWSHLEPRVVHLSWRSLRLRDVIWSSAARCY
jgi:hypothetical protein